MFIDVDKIVGTLQKTLEKPIMGFCKVIILYK